MPFENQTLLLSGNLIWRPLQFHVFFEVFGRRGVVKAVDAITVKRQRLKRNYRFRFAVNAKTLVLNVSNLLAWRELFRNLYELKSRILFWEEYIHFE